MVLLLPNITINLSFTKISLLPNNFADIPDKRPFIIATNCTHTQAYTYSDTLMRLMLCFAYFVSGAFDEAELLSEINGSHF